MKLFRQFILRPLFHEKIRTVTTVLARWREVDRTLSGRAELATLPSMTDMRDQLARLVHRGFVAEAGPDRLRRYPTWLAAIRLRRERLDEQPGRDRDQLARIADLQAAHVLPRWYRGLSSLRDPDDARDDVSR